MPSSCSCCRLSVLSCPVLAGRGRVASYRCERRRKAHRPLHQEDTRLAQSSELPGPFPGVSGLGRREAGGVAGSEGWAGRVASAPGRRRPSWPARCGAGRGPDQPSPREAGRPGGCLAFHGVARPRQDNARTVSRIQCITASKHMTSLHLFPDRALRPPCRPAPANVLQPPPTLGRARAPRPARARSTRGSARATR